MHSFPIVCCQTYLKICVFSFQLLFLQKTALPYPDTCMKPKTKKGLGCVFWGFFFTVTVIPFLLVLSEMVWRGFILPYLYAEEDRKGGYPNSTYDYSDTIIDGPAPDIVDYGYRNDVIIPLENLPVRNLSYRDIIRQFGNDALSMKMEHCEAEMLPYKWSIIPTEVVRKCESLGKRELFAVALDYDDNSDDKLVLLVYEEDEDVRILWGFRTKSVNLQRIEL